MRLEGNCIYLRDLQIQDALGEYPHWLNDKEVCKYNSHGDTLYTKDMALEYIQMTNKSDAYKVFAICDKTTNKHIGNISLQQINLKDSSAEFAILLGDKSFWGKGISKEAGRLLIVYGFSILKLRRIYCGTSCANIPMQKLALSLGMKQTYIKKDAFEKNGILYDVIEYEIIF